MKSRHQHGQDADDGSNALEGIARLSFQSLHQIGNNVSDWLHSSRIHAAQPGPSKRGQLAGASMAYCAIPHSVARPFFFFKIEHLTHFLASLQFVLSRKQTNNGGWIGNVTKRNWRT